MFHRRFSDAAVFRLNGFSSAYALVDCDCIGPAQVYEDQIENMEIFIVNDGNQTIATRAFSIQNYNQEWGSLSLFFQIREEGHDGFQIQLSDFDAIPEKASILVEVFMTSGKKYSAVTKEIVFI